MPNLPLRVIRCTVTATWLVEDQSFFLCRLGPHNYSSHLNPATFTPASLSGLTLELFFNQDEDLKPRKPPRTSSECAAVSDEPKLEFQKKSFWFHSQSNEDFFFSLLPHFQLCMHDCSFIVFTMWWNIGGNGFSFFCLCESLSTVWGLWFFCSVKNHTYSFHSDEMAAAHKATYFCAHFLRTFSCWNRQEH